MVARTSAGDCVFYHRDSGLCVIHRDLGEPMLPSTCRHFPRLAVRDRAGTFISLTHYCPTAASMLFRDDVPLEIVERRPHFPRRRTTASSSSDEDWPPLLHPDDADGSRGLHRVGAAHGRAMRGAAVVAGKRHRDARARRARAPGRDAGDRRDRSRPRSRSCRATASTRASPHVTRREPRGSRRGDDGGPGRSDAGAGRRAASPTRTCATCVRVWSAWRRAAEAVPRREGVRLVDGVPGPGRPDDRARSRCRARARARRGRATMPRRRPSARRRRCCARPSATRTSCSITWRSARISPKPGPGRGIAVRSVDGQVRC